MWWSGRTTTVGRHARTTTAPTAPSALIDTAGLAALAAMFWAWWAIAQTDTRLTHGALPLYAVGTAVIIYAATQPGLVTRLLSFAPLRGAGLISYGLYLYHWPIFLILDDNRLHWPTLPLFALRMTVTTAIALASYHLLEMPIRRGTLITTHRAALTAGLASAVIIATTATLVTLDPPRSNIPFADAKIGDYAESVVTNEPVDPSLTAAATTAHTVMIVGDSGMVSNTPGLTAALLSTGTTTVVKRSAPGFGLSGPFPWRTEWAASIAENDPDLVIVMMGGWDIKYMDANGYDAYAALVDEAVAILSAGGAHILWLPEMPGGGDLPAPVNDVYAALPDRYPGVVANPVVGDSLVGHDGGYPVVDVDDQGNVQVLRGADGWHLCPDGSARLSAAMIDAAVRLGWSSPTTPGWDRGPWRDDPAYNDPPGGCDPP